MTVKARFADQDREMWQLDMPSQVHVPRRRLTLAAVSAAIALVFLNGLLLALSSQK